MCVDFQFEDISLKGRHVSRLGDYFSLLTIVISMYSPLFAQPNEGPVGQRGDTLYTQPDQTTESNPYLEKVRLLLADPNQIRLRLNADPELKTLLETLQTESKVEDERWANRRIRIKSAFVIAARNLIDKDLAFIAKIAVAEDANQVAVKVKELEDQWKTRFFRISREIREAMRAENSTAQADRMTRTRGRRGQEQDTIGRRSARPENDNGMAAEPEEMTPAEVEENAFVESWTSADDDSADTLYSELEDKLLQELAKVRETAETLGKNRTVNAIDGVLLMRKERSKQTIAVYRERREARQNEATNTDTEEMRRGRGRRGQEGGNNTGRRRR